MLGYVFAGIALGSIYAIAASGLVVTYVASGVLNFAFGSMAFFLARFYYFLNTQEGWSQLPAVLVSVVLAGPALGALLYLLLFRHLRLASSLIRIVSTIGVSVALPPAALHAVRERDHLHRSRPGADAGPRVHGSSARSPRLTRSSPSAASSPSS